MTILKRRSKRWSPHSGRRFGRTLFSVPFLIGLVALLAAGCGGYENETDWQQQKQSMRQELEESIDSVEGQIDDLETQLAEADRESRSRIESQIDDLERQGRELEDAMSEIADQTEATWDEWSGEVQDVLDGQDS